MKGFGRKVAAALRKTWVWTLLCVLLLALIIWTAGPALAISDYRFWQSAGSRLLSISVLFLAWGLSMVFFNWRRDKRKKAEENDQQAQERIRREEQIVEQQLTLHERFRQAMRTLRTSSLYRGRSERWRRDLPWYLLLGPESSGKTSLLDYSGLEFPLNKSAEQRMTRSLTGTDYADWYFAEHAVIIDTAGRYLTQPDSELNALGWHTLLKLLRRRRGKHLNGVLVTLPSDLLLSGNEMELEALARQTRQRLLDVNQQLGVDVPVYLVLSKADQILGFDEFFDHLSQEERHQVMGASFNMEQDGTDTNVVRAEFDALLQRLNSQIIPRLHLERDNQRRGRILDFPHQLGSLGEHLGLFIELAFAGNRYQRVTQLRGFYLTSAPQLQGAHDPMQSEFSRNLGMPAPPLPAYHRQQGYFIQRLLNEVIFPESALAGLDEREVKRLHRRQRILYAAAFAGLTILGTSWALAFSANHDRFEQLRQLSEYFNGKPGSISAHSNAPQLLKQLDTRYAATLVFPPREDVRWHEKAGLYPGEQVNPDLDAAYQQALKQYLLPLVAKQLEAQIRNDMHDRELLLGSLRAYLMLNIEERRDPAYLQDWMADEWSLRYANNNAVQSSLGDHFERLLDSNFAAYPLNTRLVADARQQLRGESLASVIYRMLREQARRLPEYRMDQHMGPQALLLTARSNSIPGFYTKSGYEQMFLAQGADLVRNMLKDNWVLGNSEALSPRDLARLSKEMEALYFQDYADQWINAIAKLQLEPLGATGAGAEKLSGLAAANSPITRLLQEVRENTLFTPPEIPEIPDEVGNIGNSRRARQLQKVAELGVEAAADQITQTAGQAALQQRFSNLHQLLDADGNPGPQLANALQAMGALQMQLAQLANSSTPQQDAFDMAKSRMQGQRDAINQVRSSAGNLPSPVSNWVSLIAEDGWMLVLSDAHQYLNQRYRSELYSAYRTSLRQRYPFATNTDSDVDLADFRAFFKEQGIADAFFERYLSPFVSGSAGKYQLRRVDGRALPISREFLGQMTRVQTIRRSFFAEDPNEPSILFKLEPYSLDSSLGRASFRYGNQQMEYRHGPIVQSSFRWPSRAEEERISLVVEDLGGRRMGMEQRSGTWSLFRLLDQMEVDYHTDRDVLLLKASLGGLRANYLLHSQRAPNPFDVSVLRGFELPARL
tara:strand:+ start:6488 stop:10009 length:3522 start_codon:yes stop_codon:yes gene_type:complete